MSSSCFWSACSVYRSYPTRTERDQPSSDGGTTRDAKEHIRPVSRPSTSALLGLSVEQPLSVELTRALAPRRLRPRTLAVPSHAHIRELASIDSDILSLADPSRRLIIVGDIHGSIRPLKALLSKLKYDAKADTLLHVGDLVAKGPEPLEVLALLRKYNVQG